jgi:hypothetical protein
MDKPLEPGVRKKGRNTYQVSTEYLKEDFEKMGPEKFKQLMKNKKPQTMKKGGLSAGQKKIAAKAPPPDKIDAKDFAVLKKEKAKGRGMGLQDESIKPGKVMKAREGKMFKGYSKVFETGAEHGAKGKQPSTIVGVKPNVGKKVASKIPGRIGKTLGVVSMLVPAAYAAAKQYKDYKSAKNRDEAKVKKMGGGMMKANRGEFIKRREKLFKNFNKTIGVFPKVSSAAGGKGSGTGGRDTRTLTEKGQFIKRRMELASPKNILNAAKTTRYGKIALGIAGAALGAKELLKSKMKKEDKKMAGGSVKKYSVGTGPLGATKKPLQQGRASLPSSDIEKNKRQRLSADEIFKIKDSKQKFTGPKETKNSFGEMINKFRETEAGIKAMAKKIYPEKYLVGGVSSKEVYTNARANVDAEGRKNMTMKDLKEARRETYSTKKMVGGMAKKYNRGGGADMGDPKKPTAVPRGKDSEVMVHDMKGERPLAAPRRRRNFIDSERDKARRYAGTPGYLPKPAIGKMGGGMMNKPMGYKSGTMVKARGCKLGRTRPTKMY